MVQGLQKKGILILSLLLSVLFVSLIYQSRFINAQGNGLSLNITNKFEMNEYSNINGSKLEATFVNISLPSTEWNITKIELNFTNLTFDRETIVIEDQPVAYDMVYYQNSIFNNFGLATQIKLDHSETIYGVFIYGNKSLITTQNIQVQIQGYNNINNTPNGTVLATTTINISSQLGWYFQNFSLPVDLPAGNYFLVLNGTNFSVNGQYYHWYYNPAPSDPSLYSSFAYDTIWSDGVDNTTFLYKLIRKSRAPLFPESINMSVNINDQDYKVLNGVSEGSGFLTQTFQNFFPNVISFYIPVYNNASKTLVFHVSYHLNLEKILITQGISSVEESKSIQWILSPGFNRQTSNYSVKFDFPKSWSNISVLLDEQDMTTNVTIDLGGRFIFIPNNIITQDSGWEIHANSPNILFNLNAPKTDFNLGQELRFSLEGPIPGNYTFILMDPADTEETRIKKIIPIDDNIFSYEFPLTSPDGTYIAYVFWNNETDAGAQSQVFLISIPNEGQPDLSILIMIIIISLVVLVSGIAIYIGAKRLVKKRRYDMERLLNKCIDILNLNYLIVTDNKSGLDVYTESYGDKKLDSTLISGFLQAVREFGTHVAEKDTRIVKLDYKDTIILMKEFVNIRLILNMKDTPSEDFIYSVESLAYEIYKKYGDQIENFKGGLKQFSGIKELIDKHLNVSFLLPFKVVENPNIRLTPSEKAMVNKAIQFVKDHKFDYFYSLYLLPANECTPKDAEIILNLIEKGIFKPIK